MMAYSLPYSAGSVPRDYYPLHSVGLSRDQSGHRRCRLIWVIVVVALLAAPATAAASPPAVDQYTQHLPDAGGGSAPADGGTPVARPALLPKETQEALSGPDGERLAQIATARDLGAPAAAGEATGVTSGDGRGFASVVAHTAGTGPSLVLIGALVGIALAGAWNRFSRRGRPSADPN